MSAPVARSAPTTRFLILSHIEGVDALRNRLGFAPGKQSSPHPYGGRETPWVGRLRDAASNARSAHETSQGDNHDVRWRFAATLCVQ